MSLKLLEVSAGSSFSTKDVEIGYRDALRRSGVTVYEYALDGRMDAADRWLKAAWNRDRSRPRPTAADVVYQAGVGVIERALRVEPDWVLAISGMYLHPDVLTLLRRAGIRVALLLTESPYDDDQQAALLPSVELAWTNERTSVAPLRRHNPAVYYLPHAYDPERHGPGASRDGDAAVPAHDVVFVGTGFIERQELLASADWTGIDLSLYGAWPLLPARHKLRRSVRGGILPNGVAGSLYRRARIGLNLYRTSKGFGPDVPHVVGAESLNPRALELAADGVFTISDRRPEVAERFGDAVPTVADGRELEMAVRAALADDAGRAATAARMPGLVADRTYDAMAGRLLRDLERRGVPGREGTDA